MDVERMGPYRVLRPLGKGGMASAYLAEHETLKKEVVLKVISSTFASVESYRKRFLHEAQTLARLTHPAVVQVFDASIDDETCYMAMEYVEGEDLQKRFDSGEIIGLAWFLGMLRDVAEGLQCVHDAGLIHRDIKPANILISKTGQAKITDFGIAIETEDTLRLTRSGSIMGTPHYMSPEQALGKPVDGRSDLYSLGVVLYQGVAGRTPFKAETAAALVVKHARETPTPLEVAAPGTPRIVCDIAKRLLAKNPVLRYPSATALKQHLEEALAEVRSNKKPEKSRPPSVTKRALRDTRTDQSRQPLPWLVVAGGLAAVVLLIAIIAMLASPDRKPASGVSSQPPRPPQKTEDPPPDTPPKEPGPAEVEPSKTDDEPELVIERDKRRQLEDLWPQINLAGLAAAYCGLKEMNDQAAELRRTMTEKETQVRSLTDALRKQGADVPAVDLIRPSDRLVGFNNVSFDSMDRAAAAARLGTFVANVRVGTRALVSLVRDGRTEEISIRFDCEPPGLSEIILLAGLVPGQNVEAATQPRPRPPKNVEPKPPKEADPEPPRRQPQKLAVPSDAEQKKIEKDIREIYREDYAAGTPAGRLRLAEKLLREAANTLDDSTARFVLLREARDLAAKAGEADVAFRAIEEMAAAFAIDAFAMKVDVLAAAAPSAAGQDAQRRLADAYLELAREAADAGEYETAEKAATAAAAAAKRAKDIPLVARADAQAKGIAEVRKLQENAKKARETLAARPDDPAANLVLGRFLCLVQGKWEEGLPFLKKGSDEALKSLAARDLAGPADAAEQAAVGDGWWELSEKTGDAEKNNLRARAAYWYERAFDGLSGLSRIKVQKRLAEAGPPRQDDAWLDVTDGRRFGLSGRRGDPFRIVSGTREMSDFPPGDFDAVSLRMRFDSSNGIARGGMMLDNGRKAVYVDSRTNTLLMAHVDDASGRWVTDMQAKCPARDEYVLTLLLKGNLCVALVDGDEKLRVTTDFAGFSTLGVWTADGAIQFDQIRLRKRK